MNINSSNTNCASFPTSGFEIRYNEPRWWLRNSSTVLHLQLFLICSSMAVVHFLLKRFGVSRFSSQLITGLIFGCSWKQWDDEKFRLFTVESEATLGLLACFGCSLFLFLSAVKVDVIMILKSDIKALLIGIPSFLVPLISAFIVESAFPHSNLTQKEIYQIPLMISFHCMTSFPVIASLLSELRIVNSELGRLGLSSALILDMLGLFTLMVTGQVRGYKRNPSRIFIQIGASILLLLLILFIFRPAMLWIVKQTPEGKPIRRSFIQCVIFLALVSMFLASFTGTSALTGPYLLGLAVPDGVSLASTLVERIECMVYNIFLPVLVASCALRADVSKMAAAFDSPFTRMNVILVGVVSLTKLITCCVCSLICKLPFREALTLSLVISCKGVVELVLYTIFIDNRGISERLYGFLTLIILSLAISVPFAVRFLYDPSRHYAGYHKRNIMHLNPNSDLRLLACIHRDDNIYGLVHLLNLSCPTSENPLAVFVFHHIELVGRTTPIFISHRSQTKTLKHYPYSKNVVFCFKQFETDNNGTASVECFTAISPNKQMHDSICKLALDKNTSLIILPFHRTWAMGGIVDQDDIMIRCLNCSVLERAPCSVGIFVDGGNLSRSWDMGSLRKGQIKSYSVCVIYLGGDDDREAISFAKRMARDSRVELTVLRLKSSDLDDDMSYWDNMLDLEVLRHFKLKSCGIEGPKYLEEMSRDGTQTALRIGKVVRDYDLIIVGRRHGSESPQLSGLSEWREFKELGILGDLIVSKETRGTRASVLVIQQQIIKH